MNNIQLTQLIRESIQEYIRNIDEAGENAALEAKMYKTEEAITLREKKINMEGIDEAYHDMIDKSKMKELASEVKALKKSLARYEKQLAKLKSKGKKAEETPEEIIDEVSLNENDEDELMLAYNRSPKMVSWDTIEKEYQESGLTGEEFFADYENEFRNQFEGKPVSKKAYFNFYADRSTDSQDDRYVMEDWIVLTNQELAVNLKDKRYDKNGNPDEYGLYDAGTNYLGDEDEYDDSRDEYDVDRAQYNDPTMNEIAYMQKIAGIITEEEYRAKLKKSIAEGMDENFDMLMDAVDDYYEPNTPEHTKLRNAVEKALDNGDIDTMDFSDSPSSPYNTVARIAKEMEEENLVVTYIKNKADYPEKGLADDFHEYKGKTVKYIVGYDENDEYDEIGYIYAKNNDIKSYSDDKLDNAFMSSLA